VDMLQTDSRVDALLTECTGSDGDPRLALTTGTGAVLDGPTFAVAWSVPSAGH